MTEPLVRLSDVFVVHRTDEGDAAALQGATLTVARGEVVCVLGPSGAGKSTLLRVIAGLQTPAAGNAMVLGHDMGRIAPRVRLRLARETIGLLAQRADWSLSPALRAHELVELPLALRGAPRRKRNDRALELLEAAGLSDRAGARAAELSGGERQRVALCAALAHKPFLLLADEPTGELDEANATAMRGLIAELARAQEASVVVVSHDPATAGIADRTLRMRDGRIAEDHGYGEAALVIDRGGWLRVAPELLAQAGIGDRALVRRSRDGLLLVPAEVVRPRGGAGLPSVPSMPRPPLPVRPANVEVQAVSRARGAGASRRQVIERLSHAFAPGGLTVITGHSGVGKTTLLRLLCGLDRPDAGEVRLDDEALRDLAPEQLAALRRERIGYLEQEPSPVGFLSSLENVVLALGLRGWEREAAAEHATAVLARVGLADRSRQRVARLSAGEGQRVALARALACASGLLIVDEPTSRLDRANAASVADLLVAAARDGQTVICATHDEDVVARADEILRL